MSTHTTLILGDTSYPWIDIVDRGARAATGLAEFGVNRNDSIALLLRNDPPFFEVTTAAQRLGAYSVPINWHFTPDEVLHVLRDSNAKALVVHADLLQAIQDQLPKELLVLVIETPPAIQAAYAIDPILCQVPNDMQSWSNWLSNYPPRNLQFDSVPTAMMYTSGTTGRPKGVRREAASTEQANQLRSAEPPVLGNRPGMRVVICGPLYHAAPIHFARVALDTGTLMVLQPRFDALELLQLIERHSITGMFLAPIMFVRLLKLPESQRLQYDISSLEHVIHAGAVCPLSIKRAMIDWWGPVIHEFYGSTESGVITHCNSAQWLSHPGSVGRAVGNTTLRILKSDGTEAATHEVGEIFMRRHDYPEFTYHGDPEKRNSIERDGLITNGDLGYLDEDGYLYLCDRVRDMIISGGVNIYPAEIESVLLAFPGVHDCAVLGIPDDEYGEQVLALIEPADGQVCEESILRAYLKENLAGYKLPRVIEFRHNLPREDSGKIFKRKLREPFWEDADRNI